jgi:hypothetical protein
LEIFRKENLGFEIIKNLSNGLFNKWRMRHGVRLIMKLHLKK